MEVSREVDVVFLIADLAGYTALTEAHGSESAAGVIARYIEIAKRSLEPGERLAERAGDELLIVGADAGSLVRTALRLRTAIELEPLFPAVRAGLHGGRVLERGGVYFGPALNLAARVAAHARAGEILCTEAVARAAKDCAEVQFRHVGLVRFRHVTEPVSLFEVVLRGATGGDVVIDPVCRMQMRGEAAPARLPYGRTTYFFCSFQCAQAFAQQPDRYASA